MKVKDVLLLSLIISPCILMFNENMECWFYNVVGLVYTYFLVRNLKKSCE